MNEQSKSDPDTVSLWPTSTEGHSQQEADFVMPWTGVHREFAVEPEPVRVGGAE